MSEEWRDIEGYEGSYQISNLARVKSLSRVLPNRRVSKERILNQTPDSSGYFQVTFYRGKKRSTKKVHKLVAKSFVYGWEDGFQVNHKDRDKTNNFPENLEWCSVRENQTHKVENIKKTSIYTGVSFSGKDTKPRNKKWMARLAINGNYKFLGRFETEIEAAHKIKEVMRKNEIKNKYAEVI